MLNGWLKRIALALLISGAVALWQQNKALQAENAHLQATVTALTIARQADHAAAATRTARQQEATHAAKDKRAELSRIMDACPPLPAKDSPAPPAAGSDDAALIHALKRLLYGNASCPVAAPAVPAGGLPDTASPAGPQPEQ